MSLRVVDVQIYVDNTCMICQLSLMRLGYTIVLFYACRNNKIGRFDRNIWNHGFWCSILGNESFPGQVSSPRSISKFMTCDMFVSLLSVEKSPRSTWGMFLKTNQLQNQIDRFLVKNQQLNWSFPMIQSTIPIREWVSLRLTDLTRHLLRRVLGARRVRRRRLQAETSYTSFCVSQYGWLDDEIWCCTSY